MQQIADWLKELGISEYTQRFVENDIDVSVLPHLTDEDLKELGVSLGHRRKMLAAIAELAGSTGPSSLQPVVVIEPKPQDTAERRQVTVMFSASRFDGALNASGPGGPARGHCDLSEVRRRNRSPIRRLRIAISGRRRASLFRLPTGS